MFARWPRTCSDASYNHPAPRFEDTPTNSEEALAGDGGQKKTDDRRSTYRTILYYYIMLYYIILYHIMSYHIILYDIIVSYYIIIYCNTIMCCFPSPTSKSWRRESCQPERGSLRSADVRRRAKPRTRAALVPLHLYEGDWSNNRIPRLGDWSNCSV